eukprot:8248209-Alexandrium_andersonii.AAC.1
MLELLMNCSHFAKRIATTLSAHRHTARMFMFGHACVVHKCTVHADTLPAKRIATASHGLAQRLVAAVAHVHLSMIGHESVQGMRHSHPPACANAHSHVCARARARTRAQTPHKHRPCSGLRSH